MPNKTVSRKPTARSAVGRPPVTSRVELSRVALELFTNQGYDATTVDDIAAAAGISRRSFFRYYAAKPDAVWGDFEAGLGRMETWLAAAPPAEPLWQSLRTAIVRFNEFPDEQIPMHRQRMVMILHVPALQAHSTLRYASWRSVVSRFVAARLGLEPDALTPQLCGHLALAAAVTAYEFWLTDDQQLLPELLSGALDRLAGVPIDVAEIAVGGGHLSRRDEVHPDELSPDSSPPG